MEMKQSCQHQQLGSLVSALSTAGLLPFPTAEEYCGSVASLAEKVRALRIVRFRLPNTPPHLDSHSNCGINHKEAVDCAMGEAARLPGDIVQQLEFRARKSGAYSPELFKDIKDTEGCSASPVSMFEGMRLDHVYFKQVMDSHASVGDIALEIKAH